jgi:hypothetical protein
VKLCGVLFLKCRSFEKPISHGSRSSERTGCLQAEGHVHSEVNKRALIVGPQCVISVNLCHPGSLIDFIVLNGCSVLPWIG